MTDSHRTEKRRAREADREAVRATETKRRPYRRPSLKSGDRLETTTLASCQTGPTFCGPFAFDA